MGYSYRLTARALLYAPFHRQDSIYHGLCYTSHGALAGTRNSSMGPPWRIDPTIHEQMGSGKPHTAKALKQNIHKTGYNYGAIFDLGVKQPSVNQKPLQTNFLSLIPWVSDLERLHCVSKCKNIALKIFMREREMFYLTTHSTHFIYGYMASNIWLRTILIVRKETRCRHIGYSYRLTARVLLYTPSHRQDNTYHSLCYTSRGALAGTRNSSMEIFMKTKN